MNITFRQTVLPADRETVHQIVLSTGFFSDEELAIAVELVDEHLAKGFQSGYLFLFADEGSATCGYCCFGPIPGTAASYDLYWIAVDARYQRLGLGKRIMGEVERLVAGQGGRKIYVDTSSRPQYEPTRRFYEICGYRQEAHLKDFYAAGDGKIIFVKIL